MDDKKVLHVLWSSTFGGIERFVLELAKDQKSRNSAEPGIMILQNQGEFGGLFRKIGVVTHVLSLKSGFSLSPGKLLRAHRIFRDYDIIHLHTFNILVCLATILSVKKVVYTEHGLFGFGRKLTLVDHLRRFLLRLYLKTRVDFLTFNSHFTRLTAERIYRLHGDNSAVVYNGIDFRRDYVSRKDPSRLLGDAAKGMFIVGTTSRLAGFKRVELLVEAFSRFQSGKDTLLLVVGDGVKRKELESLADNLGIGSITHFTGYQEDVGSLQGIMDLCVFPSFNEPFGLVAVETLALGKPTVVMSDGGGMVEIVIGVEPMNVAHDLAHLVEIMERFYNLRGQVCHEDIRMRQEYAMRFDIKATTLQLDDIYTMLLAQNGSGICR
jgi:glycosyltransferase involved in cell wall biosynthesis